MSCMEGHSVPSPFLLFSLQPHFQEGEGGGGGLTGSQVLEGSYWERGGDFVQGGVALFM